MGVAFTLWECSTPIASDSDSKSCTFWLGPTAVSRLNKADRTWPSYNFLGTSGLIPFFIEKKSSSQEQ
jgi:hypothetical protein